MLRIDPRDVEMRRDPMDDVSVFAVVPIVVLVDLGYES
jgi:hypothetical protein